MTNFEKQVFSAVKQIPKGETANYQDIAKKIGRPNSSRAVGNALSKSPGLPEVPCHRVIKSNGKIGGFQSGPEKKKALLTKEGIKVVEDEVQG